MSHLTAFQQALKQNGYDAAIVSDKINQRYLSGFDISGSVSEGFDLYDLDVYTDGKINNRDLVSCIIRIAE